MPTPNGDKSSKADQEGEVWNAIAVLEQILEAVPDDQVSLHALAHAYEQIGDMSRAREYILRLAQIMVDQGDTDHADLVSEKLKAYSATDPKAAALLRRFEEPQAPDPAAAAAPASNKLQAYPESLRAISGISEEMALAWQLLQANELTQEEYSGIVRDLTEMSGATNAEGTVSVLHVIHARGSKNLDRILVAVSRECNAPIIALGSFELRLEISGMLPMKYCVRRGVLVFDTIGQELLVVVMNPADSGLRNEIQKMTSRPCHFYMTSPAEFDTAIERIRELEKHLQKT